MIEKSYKEVTDQKDMTQRDEFRKEDEATESGEVKLMTIKEFSFSPKEEEKR